MCELFLVLMFTDIFPSSYRRDEMGLRVSVYISAAGSSGAFGGLLAIGLSKIPPWGMIKSWRNIYFFEVSWPQSNLFNHLVSDLEPLGRDSSP